MWYVAQTDVRTPTPGIVSSAFALRGRTLPPGLTVSPKPAASSSGRDEPAGRDRLHRPVKGDIRRRTANPHREYFANSPPRALQEASAARFQPFLGLHRRLESLTTALSEQT